MKRSFAFPAVALAWTCLGVALACGALELFAGLGYRLGWWHFHTGIQILRWSATFDLAAAALAAAIVAFNRGARARLEDRRSVAAGAAHRAHGHDVVIWFQG